MRDLNHLTVSYKDNNFLLTMTIFFKLACHAFYICYIKFSSVFRLELWNSQILVAHALGEDA